jgi:predicted DsbA family dithiol-disulfide isomerase
MLALRAERHPDVAPPAVRWLPFQLNPQLPPEGIPRAEYVARKFGGRTGVYERVTAVGHSVGIPFAFDRITVQPNTLNAHRLLMRAEDEDDGRQEALAEALFRAYFIEGADLTRLDTLADLAAAAGMDRAAALAYLAGDEDRAPLLEADAYFRERVNGVPYFIFNRKVGVSGAQEAEILLDAFEQALRQTTS